MIAYDQETKELKISYPAVSNPEDLFKHLATHLMSSAQDEVLQGLGSDIWGCLAGKSDEPWGGKFGEAPPYGL